jgi:cytochrome c-type biogenesis protein CcmF
MAPLGLMLLLLMGVAPLFGWRKTSGVSLRRAFALPTGVLAVTVFLHLMFGSALGFPALVEQDQFYPGIAGAILQKVGAAAPLITVALVSFNFGVIGQEFGRGVAARRRKHKEGVLEALLRLVDKSRRRYGGYIVHMGVGLMFLGFCGRSWEIEQEASMQVGEVHRVGGYALTYEGPRMEVDSAKRMIFADLRVTKGDSDLGRVSPARFIFKKGGQPTTEVSMLSGLRDDLYVVVGSVDPTSKRATFRFHVNPLVAWIWTGVFTLILGALLSLWPDVKLREIGVWGYVRATAGAATGIMVAILAATSPAHAASTTSTSAAPATGAGLAKFEASNGALGAHASPLATCVALGLAAGVASVISARRRDN